MDTIRIKRVFDRHNNIVCTRELRAEGISAYDIKMLLERKQIERIRRGYYQWVGDEPVGEAVTITRLFPDAILCMDTALRHYGYSDRTPGEWHLAVNRYCNRNRFSIPYPFIKPYYVQPDILALGLCQQEMDGVPVRMYDKERVICDCIRHRNKMDKEIFNTAIQNYIKDPMKSIPRLMEYAARLRVTTAVRDLIGVWL